MPAPFRSLARSKTLTGVGLTALLLCGCASTTLEPAYHQPAAPVPAQFPQDPADQADPISPAVVQTIGWRAFFTDPKLQAVIALGLDNNRDLRVAIANIEAARAQYRVQRADLLPSLNATGSAFAGRQLATTTANGTPLYADEHEYTASAGVSGYEVDLFGRVRSLTKSALQSYLATAEARRASQISIISEIAGDYLTLAADKAIQQTASDTLASSRAALEVTQARFDHGVASELDTRQAETLVDQARADLAADVAKVAQDRAALDLVVGATTPDNLLPDAMDERPLTLAQLPVGLPSSVLLARPDVLEAEHQLIAANAKIGAARAAFFPKITLTASGGATSLDLASLFKGPAEVWSFTPQVTLPIFNGGANIANLNYAKAEQRVSVAQYEKAIQTAFSDVASALARRATIDEQIAADEAQVAAAADTVRLSQARYDRGSDTYLNLLTAQRTLYAAQQALVAARLIKATNLVSLYGALGGGGEITG